MPEYLSGKKRISNIGIRSYSENANSTNVIGNVIVTSGKIGVGTTVPTEDVDVKTIRIRDTVYDSTNYNGALGYYLSKDNNGIKWVAVPPIQSNAIFVAENNNILGVSSFTGINIISDELLGVSTNPINPNFADINIVPRWLRSGDTGIYTTKNVGIGTTIPTADFQVGFGTTGVTIDGTIGVVSALGYYGDYAYIKRINSDYSILGVNTVSNFLNVVGLGTTSVSAVLASSGGITTTGGDLYVGKKLYAESIYIQNLDVVDINSTGIASLFLSYINTGFVTSLTVTGVLTANELNVTGITSLNNLFVNENVDISGITTTNIINAQTGIITNLFVDNGEIKNLVSISATISNVEVPNISGVNTLTGIGSFYFPNGFVDNLGVQTFNSDFINSEKGQINYLSGVAATFNNITSINSIVGNSASLSNLGVSTATVNYLVSGFASVANFESNNIISAAASIVNLNSSGFSTLGIVSATEYYGLFKGSLDPNVIAETSNYSKVSGIATYAVSSGVSTYATRAGVATNAEGLIGAPNLNVGIVTAIEYYGLFKGSIDPGITIENANNSNYSKVSGIATYAVSSGVSTYATRAGVATNAEGLIGAPNLNVGIVTAIEYYGLFKGSVAPDVFIENSNYAKVSGFATYSTSSGLSTYAISSGFATYSTSSGLSTYAISSGFATYSTSSGLSTYAISSGFVTYSTSSGLSTYAISSGFATYSTSSGISTNVVGGIASISSLQVNGISTFISGPVLIGTTVSTGTTNQLLQVNSGAFLSGSLGIGTTNPSRNVDIRGTVRITGQFYDRFNNPGTQGQIIAADPINNSWYWAPAPLTNLGILSVTDDVTYYPTVRTTGIIGGSNGIGTASYLNIDNTATGFSYKINPARVGIGTSNPSTTLDVGGNTNLSGKLTISSRVNAFSTERMDLQTYGIRDGALSINNWGGNQLFNISNISDADTEFKINQYNSSGIVSLFTATRNVFSVSVGGTVSSFYPINVGIGLTNSFPGDLTSRINGPLTLVAPHSTAASQVVKIVPKYSDLGAISFEAPIGTARTDRGTQIFSISNNLTSTIFRVNDVNRNTILETTASGNVGIGTTLPQTKLQVSGTTRVTSLGSTATEQIDIKHYRDISSRQSTGIGNTNNRGAISFDGFKVINGVNIPVSLFALSNGDVNNVFSVSGYKFVSGSRDSAIDVTLNGRLGIGITNPITDFQINRPSYFSQNIGVNTVSAGSTVDIRGNLLVTYGNNTTERIYLNPQTSGINTYAPTRGALIYEGILDVFQNSGGQLVSVLNDNTNLFTVTTFVGLSSTRLAPTGQKNVDTVFQITGTGNVGIGTSVPIQPFQVGAGSSIVVIDRLGRLGVGTTNPTVQLDVRGNSFISGVSTVGLASTSSLSTNSTFSFELTNNTTLTVRVRGTDGVVRTGIITLA